MDVMRHMDEHMDEYMDMDTWMNTWMKNMDVMRHMDKHMKTLALADVKHKSKCKPSIVTTSPKHIAYDIHGLDEHCSNGMVDTKRTLVLHPDDESTVFVFGQDDDGEP